MAAVDLAGLLHRLHLLPCEITQACAVSARTVRRWHAMGAPVWVARVLEARAGLIPLPGWHGWQARPGGVLRDPYGVDYHAHELRAAPYLRELVSELRRQIAAATAERDALRTRLDGGAVRCRPRRRAGLPGRKGDARIDGGGSGGTGGLHHDSGATLQAGG